MQAPINSRLGKSVGGIQAATFSFLVGTAALVLLSSMLHGGLGSLGHLGRAPWWALVGGLLGAVYVFVAIESVHTLGASGLTAVVIAGQLTISVVIDRFGLLGIAKQQISSARIVGLVLLVAGVTLVVRK
jgi:transporter family-2 protein